MLRQVVVVVVVVAIGIAVACASPRVAWASASPAGTPTPVAEAEAGPSADAEAGYQRGLASYAARDFHRAIAELEAAFALDPRPEFLFAEAQALRLDGNCPRAIEMYQRFLATRPPPLQVQATQLGLDRCTAVSASAASASVAGASPIPSGAMTVDPGAATPRRQPAPGHRAPDPAGPASAARVLTDRTPPAPPPSALARLAHDPWTVVPLSVALAALGIGAGVWVASNRAQPTEIAGTNTTYDDFARAWQTAGARREVAIGALATGAVLGTVGAVRAWWLLRDGQPPPAGRPAETLDSRLLFDGRWLTLAGRY